MTHMRVKLDPGAKMPTRAHFTDAGYDLYSREDKVVPARGNATFDTGVHIELKCVFRNSGNYVADFNTCALLVSKSGLNVHHDILNTGLIDMGYTGSIRVKLYNHSDKDYVVHKGDKISQMILFPVLTPQLMEVDELCPSERGDGGFGSTGR